MMARGNNLQDQLFGALYMDDAAEVTRLLLAGAPVVDVMPYDFGTYSMFSGMRPLDAALHYEKYQGAAVLLDGGAPVDSATQHPPLHSVFWNGRRDWVERLLDKGANPMLGSAMHGQTPLHVYAYHDGPDPSAELLDLILGAGAQIDVLDAFKRTPIMTAFGCSRRPYVDMLAARGARVDAIDAKDRTTLHWAMRSISRSQEAILERMLDGRVNAPDSNGLTPLHICARFTPWALGKLINAGGNPTIKDNDGRTIIHHAMIGGLAKAADVVELDPEVLTKDAFGRDALFYASAYNLADPSGVKLLVELGGDPSGQDMEGCNALVHLLRLENDGTQLPLALARVYLLGGMGVDPSVVDDQGRSALHYLASGEPPAYRTPDVNRPLPLPYIGTEEHESTFEGDRGRIYGDVAASLLTALLRYPGSTSSIEVRDRDGDTPFLACCDIFWLGAARRVSLLKVLLSARPDLNANSTRSGSTGLHRLVGSYNAEEDALQEAMLAVCSQNADVNARNFDGDTPLMIAKRENAYKTIALLRRFGAQDIAPLEPAVIPTDETSWDVRLEPVDVDLDGLCSERGNSPVDWPRFFQGLAGIRAYPLAPDQVPDEAPATAVANEDPLAPTLNSEALALYRTANEAYQAEAGTLFPYIKLTSARRDVRRQAELYEQYIHHIECKGPKVPAANKPGASFHNFGVSVDIVRGGDSARLDGALTGAGWVKSHEDEGWHYDAKAIKAWSGIAAKVAELGGEAADKLAFTIVDQVIIRCRVQEEEPKFRAEQIRIRALEQNVRQHGSEVIRQRDAITRTQNQVRQEDTAIERERLTIAELRRRANSMAFNSCPNGNPYA